MKNFLALNDHEIDIDIYDLQSRHFGLFCEDKPAGFLRIVYPKKELYQENIFNIGCKYNIFSQKTHNKKDITNLDYPDFPFISYSKVPCSIQNYYNNLNAKNETLVEPSRLMLFQNVSGINKAKFLTECAIVLYHLICIGKKHAVINCDVRHERFYQRYGFEKINSTENYHLKDRNTKSSSLLTLRLASSLKASPVCKEYHDSIENMVNEFNNTNVITRII
ncbi:MAG: hypothetical protein ABJK28_12205 [Algibacter sp.]